MEVDMDSIYIAKTIPHFKAHQYGFEIYRPDWFANLVTENRVITHSVGTCNVQTAIGYIQTNVGDYVVLSSDDVLTIESAESFREKYYRLSHERRVCVEPE